MNISTDKGKHHATLGVCIKCTHKPGVSFNSKLAALVSQTMI